MINIFKRLFHKMDLERLKKNLAYCGKNVYIDRNFSIIGEKNISCGDSTYIGVNSVLMAAGAPIDIKGHFMSGPGLTIITGDHRTDIRNKYMDEVTTNEKLPSNDQPVKIEKDVWCGANVTVLKGVTISQGCVIAAGSVLTCSTNEYEIWGGVPARKLKNRFE